MDVSSAEQRSFTVYVEFTDAFMESMSRRQYLRKAGRAFVAIFLCGVLGWIAASLLRSAWMEGFFASFSVFAAVLGLTTYAKLPIQATQPWRDAPYRTVTYTFDDGGYSIESWVGHGRFRWEFIARAERLPDCWLLYQRDGRVLFVPIPQLSEGLARLLMDRLSVPIYS